MIQYYDDFYDKKYDLKERIIELSSDLYELRYESDGHTASIIDKKTQKPPIFPKNVYLPEIHKIIKNKYVATDKEFKDTADRMNEVVGWSLVHEKYHADRAKIYMNNADFVTRQKQELFIDNEIGARIETRIRLLDEYNLNRDRIFYMPPDLYKFFNENRNLYDESYQDIVDTLVIDSLHNYYMQYFNPNATWEMYVDFIRKVPTFPELKFKRKQTFESAKNDLYKFKVKGKDANLLSEISDEAKNIFAIQTKKMLDLANA
jgi:hypothetical protein